MNRDLSWTYPRKLPRRPMRLRTQILITSVLSAARWGALAWLVVEWVG
jgi:hypothetical protein